MSDLQMPPKRWLMRLRDKLFKRWPNLDLATLGYVVLDTETTGFDFEKDRILSIGALRLTNETIRVSECLEIFIRQEHYNKGSTEVHCILSQEERPLSEEREALLSLLEYLGNDVIVAHHANFDITMIRNALKRQGLPDLQNLVLDTSWLYRKTIISSPLVPKKDRYTLDELADRFGISKKDRHTALGDAYITAIAFVRILHGLRRKGITRLSQVRR